MILEFEGCYLSYRLISRFNQTNPPSPWSVNQEIRFSYLTLDFVSRVRSIAGRDPEISYFEAPPEGTDSSPSSPKLYLLSDVVNRQHHPIGVLLREADWFHFLIVDWNPAGQLTYNHLTCPDKFSCLQPHIKVINGLFAKRNEQTIDPKPPFSVAFLAHHWKKESILLESAVVPLAGELLKMLQ